MMIFRNVKANIETILVDAAAGRYDVVGYQKQTKPAISGGKTVQVYYSAGDFPKRASALNSPVQHEASFKLDLTVSAPAEVDLTVLNNPSATAAQLTTALANMQDASKLADDFLDELFDDVFQVLMDGDNYNLSLPPGTISNKWIPSFQKDTPLPRGEFVVLTGSMELECRMQEELLSVATTPFDANITDIETYDTTGVEEDPVQKTGVTSP